eukprot:gene3937-14015_t
MEGRDVEYFLTAHPPLAAHVEVFKENGFESLEMLALATEADLATMGILMGHRRLLQSKLPEQIQKRVEEAPQAMHQWRQGPYPNIHFLFDARSLGSFKASILEDMEMEDGDHVDVIWEQIGDIGHFGPHLSSPGAALLSSSSAALGVSREEVVCVVEQVCRESLRGKLEGGAGELCSSVWGEQQEPQWHAPSQSLPSEQQRLAVMRVLDEHWMIQQQQQQQEDHYHEAGTSVRDALLASSPVTPLVRDALLASSPVTPLVRDALLASSPVTPFADFKVELSRSELESVVGVESVACLVSLFGGRVDKIKLRRVSAGSHGAGHGGEQGGGLDACCIPFHLDEAELTMQLTPPCLLPPAPCSSSFLLAPCSLPPASAHTSLPPTPAHSSLPPDPCPVPQVALNSPDDYTGGDLVFLLPHTASALVPSRSPGSTTVQDNSVVHRVTRMQAGVRYSLFLMQLLDMQVGGEGGGGSLLDAIA